VRALDDLAIEVDDVGLRRPTLDEVFLTLTGSPIDGDADADDAFDQVDDSLDDAPDDAFDDSFNDSFDDQFDDHTTTGDRAEPVAAR
jgi:hypothetical protein